MNVPGRGFAALALGLCASLPLFGAGQDDEPRKAVGPDTRPLVPEDTLPTPFVRTAPRGVEPLAEGFTASEEEFALGRALFFDPVLSGRGTIACASCHRPEFAFADNRATSRGIEGYLTRRNAPAIFNKGLSENLLWDGRASTLEEQVVMPIENPEEMALGIAAAVNRLGFDEDYDRRFREVYGREVNGEDLAKALAAFVRGLTVGDSPVDRFRLGERAALTPDEEAGLWIYEGKGGCWKCHNGPNFSDEDFHNTGVGAVDGVPARGRCEITGDEADRGRFRTPGLRMLTKTAPYMHDGSIETLAEVVEFYRRGGNVNSNRSDRMRELRLTDTEARQLVAFLEALSR
ncbi:MAG: cytochrome c peroxidase [Planctomycetota bacterium]|nr:cytochrome c peroxidase [Planctomycetota bacterium]